MNRVATEHIGECPCTTITFLGISSCIPDAGHETACFLINGRHMVDTGWMGVLRMREYGFDPLNLETIIFTHMHHDHYIGLPHILFYLGLKQNAQPRTKPLKIIGPADDIKRVVELSFNLLQIHHYPELHMECEIVGLNADERYVADEFELTTFAAKHASGKGKPIQALVYKFTDTRNGVQFAFTGDTHHHPPIADFVRGVPLLIHDAAHTSPADAAEIARRAKVGKLVLIHLSEEKATEALVAAQAVFPNTFLPREGETLTLLTCNYLAAQRS